MSRIACRWPGIYGSPQSSDVGSIRPTGNLFKEAAGKAGKTENWLNKSGFFSAADGFEPRTGRHFVQDMCDMIVDGCWADKEPFGDAFCRVAGGDEAEDLDLSRGQLGKFRR